MQLKQIFSLILTKDGIQHPNIYPKKQMEEVSMHKHLRLHFQKRTLDQIHECYRQDGPSN